MIKRKNESLLDMIALQNTLRAYNPWWEKADFVWPNPKFKRDFFAKAIGHVEAKHDLALLINGPRRVGKTTLMYQVMEYLVRKKRVLPGDILFFSLDDPFMQQLPKQDQGGAFEKIMQEWEVRLGHQFRELGHPVYCFLDEVQRLPNWELYIKRYVDLHYPIRFVISGSASHTIFRKSLESLLGRLIDISLPPFTFREWLRFHHPKFDGPLEYVTKSPIDISDRKSIVRMVKRLVEEIGAGEIGSLKNYVNRYAQSGGFPQLWQNINPIERAQFVDLQFVQRVTLEDLRLVKEIRRPEIFHQFLRYAFARTGEEYNLEELAGKIKTTRVTLTGALPLLLQTELIRKVERFTNKPVRLRSTHAKLYATDLTLYEAITKIPADLKGEDKGRIAETLAFNAIRRFAGITDISYFRSSNGSKEIDFIVRIGRALIPIEVKYRVRMGEKDKSNIADFIDEYGREADFGIVITENEMDFEGGIIEIPLGLFLLLI